MCIWGLVLHHTGKRIFCSFFIFIVPLLLLSPAQFEERLECDSAPGILREKVIAWLAATSGAHSWCMLINSEVLQQTKMDGSLLQFKS